MKYKKLLINFFKPHLVRIILIIIGIGILSFFKLSFDFLNSNNRDMATLFINLETEKRFFEGEVVGDMTMLYALNMAVLVGEIKLNYAIDESGNVNIMEIDGHANGINNKYFVFSLNSKIVAPKDLNKEIVHNKDKIEIRFQ